MPIDYAHPDGNLRRAGTGAIGPAWTGGAPEFIRGTTMPVPGVNVGAGTSGHATPTQTITTGGSVSLSGVTYTISGPVSNRVIPGFVNLTAAGSLTNCLVTGPPTAQAVGRAIVQGPASGGQAATVDFCTISPTVPTSYYDGVGSTNLHVTRSVVRNCTDSLRVFDWAAANGGTCNFRFLDSWAGELCQHEPDIAGNRDRTHNDSAQMQGNPNGSATDILIDGSVLDARGSTTDGVIPAVKGSLAGVMVTPAGSIGPVKMTVTRSWLLGGLHTVNCLNANLTSASVVVITDTRFERPGTDPYAPSVAWSVKATNGPTITNTGNTYIDNGAPVSVTYI